jgi:nucleoside-diphosphate-sugar epimerase
MKVMVLGASGFIGAAVVRRLLAKGHEAVAVSRRGGPARLPGAHELSLDRTDRTAMAQALARLQPDAVIDLLAMTIETTRPLLEVLAGATGRYVIASSGDVYRQYARLHRFETGPSQVPLVESADLRARLHPYRADPRRAKDDPQAWMDEYDKIPIERALARTALSWSVIRLPMVFGPRDRQRRFRWAIGPMLAETPELRIDDGWASWRSTYGYVDDVAEALVLGAVHPAATKKVFNAGPQEVMTHLEWARSFAEHIGWSGKFVTIEREAVPDTLKPTLNGLDLRYPLVLDTSAIRSQLGYEEVTSHGDRLQATVRDERER